MTGASRTVVVVATTDRAATLAAFADALSFPTWFGHNLDALADCLRDLSWLPAGPVVVHWHDAELRRADPDLHRVVLEILDDAVVAQAGGDHPVAVVRGD